MSSEKETYVRRRAFNKIHVTSWLIYLEKDGFVRCPFQNCNFMAFDVNEMCEHYGFCKGDSNFAKYVCEVCKGCTVSEKRLHEHRSQAHNITILPEQAEAAAEAEEADPGKPSRVLMLSWGFFFDKHNYIKCSNCQYIANTMSEMCRHYLVCKQEKKFLLYVCPECKGRSRDVMPLIQHLERAHKISKRPDQFNHISRNMVQFWEKELRDDKYATCLHINSDKERDCQYIDLDVLGINEHSQTCKGPQHVISSRQWFCQFCPKWASSCEKLTKHQLLSHYELCNSTTLVENNDQSNYLQSAVQTVKQEVLNNSPKATVPKRFSPANKFVSFRSKETRGLTKKEPNVPVKPFEQVFIIKGDYDMGNPLGSQITIEKKNCVNELQPNHKQKEIISAHSSVLSIPGSVKKCNGERNVQDLLQSNVHPQASELVDGVNVSRPPETMRNNIIVEECAFSNPDQEHQEIFLDLVEDKLVARKSVDEVEENNDLVDNMFRQKVCERQDSSMSTLHFSRSENHKPFEEETIEIIDVAEDEFISGKCVGNATNKCKSEEREPEVIQIEEGFSLKEEFEIDGLSIVKGSVSSGCIRDISSLPFKDCNNKTSAKEHSSGTVHKLSQELFQDEIEVLEFMGENSTVVKDQGKEVCQKKENLLVGSKNKREKVCKPIKDIPCYVLFKDDFSSEEENCTEKGDRKKDDIKLSFDWRSAYSNKSPKNYTRRKSSDDKLERCSPTKPVNSLYNQNSHAASGGCFSGVAEVKKTTAISCKGKKSYENLYKTQMQAKNNLVFQNSIHNFDELEEEASKNSEKNDKLMLMENPSAVLNKGPNLGDKNQIISSKKESIPGIEMPKTCENYFGYIPTIVIESEGESIQESFDGRKLGCSKSYLDESNKLKPIEKDLCFKKNVVTSDEILNDFQLRGYRENKKSSLLNSTVNVEEAVQGNANKGTDCIDLTEDDSQESSKGMNCHDESSSLNLINLKKATNHCMTATEENDKVSSEPKVVSFFYSGKLNKPFLGSNTLNKQKSTGDANQSITKTLLRNHCKFFSNEPSSSGRQFVDKPLNDSAKFMEEQNSPHGNGKEMDTIIAQVANNTVGPDLKLDLVSRIQSDFLVDSSSDEETIGNKKTMRSKKSFVGIGTAASSVDIETSTSPVEIKTNLIPVGIESGTNAASLEKSLTDLERKIKVCPISSGFCEESSLDEEDFLGTDEELDMKDQFFSGFQEISENLNSKNKRFRQFLNRLSESENEEWYVNAGNLSMDVRKDNSFSQNKSMNLKGNYEHDSSRSFGKETTVVVVDDDEEDKAHEYVNVCVTNLKSKFKENKEFVKGITHNTYKNDFIKDKPNKLEKAEICSKKMKDVTDDLTDKDLLFNDYLKENSITVSSLGSRPIESFKISLSIDKLNLSSKCGIETNSIQRAEKNRFDKSTKVIEVNANNNSIALFPNKRELAGTIAKEYVVIKDLSVSRDYNSDQEVKKQLIKEVKPRNDIGDTSNSNVLESLIKNQSNNHQDDMSISDNSNNDLMTNISFPIRNKDQVHLVINKNTLYSEIKISDQKEILLVPGITSMNSETGSCKLGTDVNASMYQTGKHFNDSPGSNSLKNQFMFKPECSNEFKTSISGDVSGQMQETRSVENTPATTPKYCNSSVLFEDETKQNFKFDVTTYSDDEPLSVIQKVCQSSVKAVLSTKGNLLTEGFSPHGHIQENNVEEERLHEKKQAHLVMTSPVIETNQNYSHGVNSDIENIKTGGNEKVAKVTKKRGRKPKRDQDEFKIKQVINNSDNDGMNKTPTNKTEKLQEISLTSLSNHDIAICDTSKTEEVRLNAFASETSVELDNSRIPEIPSLRKRRGRPPKRKVNEMSTNLNQGVDLNTLYEPISDDELLLSVFSEEVENILVSGLFEGSKDRNCWSQIVPSEFLNSDKGNQAISAGSKGVSPQKQHDLQNNTMLDNISEIKVPKKRGRKPQFRLESNSSDCILNTGNSSVSDEINFVDEVKNSSIETLCDVEIKVPKKRGRKPKLKLESSSPKCTLNTPNSSISDIVLQDSSTKHRDSSAEKSCDTITIKVPKKRGRKPKLKLGIDNSEWAVDTPNSSIKDNLLLGDGRQFTDLIKASSTEKLCDSSAIKVSKKRGRPTKVKSQSFLHIDSSFHCESSILEYSKPGVSEIDETACKKNITSSNPHISSSENIPLQPDISQLEYKEEVIVLPKKRGRKPGSKLKLDSSLQQQPTNLGNETCNIPEKRGRISSRNKLNKEKITPDKNENLSLSRRRKLAKLNSDINDTTSEVSSVADMDCTSSVTSELLGTDVILINEVKLNSSHSSNKRSRKCKGKPAKKLEDSDDDSGGYDPEKLFSSDDSDDDINYEIPRQPNKRRKIESDQNCSASDGETEKKTANRGIKKIGATSGGKIYFKTKHRKDDKIVCGVCKQEMIYSTYRNHHAIFKHYMLTWLEGEENPVDMNNQKEVEGRLWFAKKRIGKTPFRCSICSLPKLSAVGFYSHIRFCGKDNEEKESLLVTCELCGARLMPSSVKPHMYMKHSAKPPEADSKKGLLDQTLIVKGPRAAATRAVEVIQQSQADCQDGEGAGSRSNSPERKSQLYHLYLRPSRIVPPIEYRRWKDSLATTHTVACTVQGCDFTANSTVGFRKHYFTCPFAPPRLYKCRVCPFTSSAEEPMVRHVEERHEEEIFSQLPGSDNETSDESDGEVKQAKAVGSGSNLPFKFLKVIKQQKKGGRFSSRKTFFTVALRWTLNLRESMFASEPLYPGAVPQADHWQPLTVEGASPYLPDLGESIRFRGSGGAWQTLRRFHSCIVDGVAMLFAGGPVWATAWAPVPNPEEHQYLAVVPHSSVEHTHKMASLYSYPGLIQIWTLGTLGNTGGEVCSPRLVVGLAQQRGPVWGLAWCPAGAYSQERLGLLAAACGDGSVVVYAVPRATHSDRDLLSCCLSVKPEWELKLGCEMMAQCTCVDWHSAAPHSIIAGGFANGMVALWDLTTTSPLLKFGSTILPFKVIEAHHSAVTAVRLSCTKENIHMMTASLDRATKFWRLDDTTAPVNSLRKASVTDAVMTNNWLLSISAYDDVYSINNSHVTGCTYRDTFTSANSNYILQPGTVWGLSFSDWLNACACASEMGKVNAFFRQQLLVSEDSKKSSKSALIEDLVSCSAHSIRDDSLVTSGFGPMYNDCASTMGLEFHFGGNTKEPKTASACSSDNMDSFPIRSFNAVSWNPNMSSFTWLAAGMQCGLVVIPRVSSVHPSDLAELNQHKDNR